MIVDGRGVLIVIVSKNTATGMSDIMAICTEGTGVVSVFKHFVEAEWGASSPYFGVIPGAGDNNSNQGHL